MKSFFTLLLASASVYAAAPNVGLLDEQEIFKKYAKAVDLQAEVRKSEESAQASIGERVKVVEQLQTELLGVQKRGQDPMLSENGKKAVEAEFQQKSATFQQRRAELQNFVNEARGASDFASAVEPDVAALLRCDGQRRLPRFRCLDQSLPLRRFAVELEPAHAQFGVYLHGLLCSMSR